MKVHRLPVPVLKRVTPVLRHPAPKRSLVVRSLGNTPLDDLVEISYWVGKATTLFVGFYCALQWLHYRELANTMQENEDKKDKKDDETNA